MWFLNNLPIEWKQTFHCSSEPLGKQKNRFVIEIQKTNDADDSCLVAIPYPYVVSKLKNSLRNLKFSFSTDTYKVFKNTLEFKTYITNTFPHLRPIACEFHNQYSYDEIGVILVEIPVGVECTMEYIHKIHYSSSLYVPIKLNPAHCNEIQNVDTNIFVTNINYVNLPRHAKFVGKENDTYHFTVDDYENAFYYDEFSFPTLNWDSSDDDEISSESDEGIRLNFLNKVKYGKQ